MIRRSHFIGLASLALVAAAVFCASLLVGSASLSVRTAATALLGGADEFARTIMQSVRLPRAIAAFSVGALLGLAGTLLQALFRNPLADPFVLGVSGGCALGAIAGMMLGAGLASTHWWASAGGLGVGLLVLWLGRGGGTLRLLLSGVVMASACGALITVMLTLADVTQVRGMIFWLAGDLGWAQNPMSNLAAAAIALLIALVCGRQLNVLASGELRSAALGLEGSSARLLVFVLTAILTAFAVISAGMIGFIGLLAPHLVRLSFRTSDHRVVAPGAALAGGLLLCCADMLSRTLAAPRELPIGAVTALIGAPLFLVLLRRQRS